MLHFCLVFLAGCSPGTTLETSLQVPFPDLHGAVASRPPAPASDEQPLLKLPPGVPDKVARILQHIDRTGTAPRGFVGGRTFLNLEKLLPGKDSRGHRIRYQEWDVNPHRQGINRGPERLVTGSDGSAYYTDDHYRSFKKIR